MNNKLYNQDSLFAKYLSGNMSSDEQDEFMLWLKSSSENTSSFQKYKKVWEQSSSYISSEDIIKDKLNVLSKVQAKSTLQMARSHRQLLLYKIAAILAIPITFALSWYFTGGNQANNQAVSEMLCEVTAPKGHVAKCVLPDGSEVWVNTGSTVAYNVESFNDKSREVELSGEAYFEVAKNTEKPFTVKTPVANILVTGTSFNIKAYPDSDLFETILAEGSIDMELNNTTQQKISLVPGERAVYKAGAKSISIEQVEPEYFTSWRTGDLLFKDATLNDLVVELERVYDIKFHIEDKQLGEFRFRGMFSYNNNLIEALEKIKRTAQIDYRIENKEVWLTKSK
ncbi:FecR family protein [Draconibacterium mangrovi]|uniref:FecR family protein n=1 Tax=Draconibacterium mangrovi TaxID=2697469 RepID=UPI0013D65C1D|nr:FecR domain-containing protein [Draconibacterium mangrovi]